jgi:DNA-directed RNA polymerase specialized sigma24 family protein
VACGEAGANRWRSANDREAFWAEFKRVFMPRIRAYIAKSGCSRDEVDELAAATLADLALIEATLVVRAPDWSLVKPLVRRACADAARRWRHELLVPVSRLDGRAAPPSSGARELYLERLRAWADRLTSQLPPSQRKALKLRVLESRSYAQVARALSVSEGAARFSVYAALRSLRHAVESFPPPHQP